MKADIVVGGFKIAFENPFSIPVTKHTGFVAFMDILGYSNIHHIDANIAGLILGLMDSVLSMKNDAIQAIDPREDLDSIEAQATSESFINSMQHWQTLFKDRISIALISDSILCVANMDDLSDEEDMRFVMDAYIATLSRIITYMFGDGLPLRGGITYGDFYPNRSLSENPSAFLGPAILEAHKLECLSNTACVYFDDHAAEKCLLHCSHNREDSNIQDWADLCQSKVTMRPANNEIEIVRDALCINIQNMRPWLGKERKKVEWAFKAFNKWPKDKEAIEKVSQKLENTVRFLTERQQVGTLCNQSVS